MNHACYTEEVRADELPPERHGLEVGPFGSSTATQRYGCATRGWTMRKFECNVSGEWTGNRSRTENYGESKSAVAYALRPQSGFDEQRDPGSGYAANREVVSYWQEIFGTAENMCALLIFICIPNVNKFCPRSARCLSHVTVGLSKRDHFE